MYIDDLQCLGMVGSMQLAGVKEEALLHWEVGGGGEEEGRLVGTHLPQVKENKSKGVRQVD